MESWPTFEVLNVKNDNINNVCQLICFPLSQDYLFVQQNVFQSKPGMIHVRAMQTPGF
jgi:hypothetical protein